MTGGVVLTPLAAIRALHAVAGDQGDAGVQQHFAAALADPAVAAQVPVLCEETAEQLPNQCLVRFRGMVADMPNPEYYVGAARRPDGSWASAQYADELEEAIPEGAETRIAERRPLLLVPVPGESEWAAAPAAAAARASLAAFRAAQADAAGAAGVADGAAGGPKRQREDGQEGEEMEMSLMVSDATGQTTTDDGDSAAAGRARRTGGLPAAAATGAQVAQEASSGAAGAARPAADLPPGCCMCYVYDEREVKLNDVVEVVGVLSRVPQLAAAHMAGGAGDGQGAASMLLDDVLASHLPTSRVPRLHAILLESAATAAAPVLPPSPAVSEARARALGFLSQVLGGDELAAEYLLLQLVGRVHLRTAESAVGALSLNLVAEAGNPAAAAAGPTTAAPTLSAAAQPEAQELSLLGGALATALAALAPRCLALPLSVGALNARPWWPRRDQNTQRLVSGLLQLAPNTQVLLDESLMAAGTLQDVGLRNLAALQTLVAAQKVAYDFEFFALDQPADAPVTVLSLGRSLLKDCIDLTLPLRPTAPLADAASVASAAASADLAPLRAYLAAARAADFSIGPDMEAFLAQELAGARQRDREVNERTCHTWMNLARLLALSHGEAALSRERWAAVQALEARRQERLPRAAAQPSA